MNDRIDTLVMKYHDLMRAERGMVARVRARSERLKDYRLSSSCDELREAELQAGYERAREALGDLHGRLNLLKTEIGRQLKWSYERRIYDLEQGPQSAATVSEITRLTAIMNNTDREAEMLLK